MFLWAETGFFSILGRSSLLIKRRFKGYRTTDSHHRFRVYGNLLKDFVLTSPHQALVSDITYIRTDEGFMYLSLVMDAYSRTVVGYDCSDNLEAEGTLRSLTMALRGLPATFKPPLNCRRPHQSLGYRCPMEVHLAA